MRRQLAGLGFAALVAASGACGKTESPSATAKPTEAPKPTEEAKAKPEAAKPEAAKPDFTISARDLYAEFRPQIEAGTADAVRAKYTGKVVRISGEVKTNADMLGTWELALVANDQTGLAYLHPSAAGLADVRALKPGDKVTLQCVSDGWEIGPQLKECALVR
jgi:hypothetical protein